MNILYLYLYTLDIEKIENILNNKLYKFFDIYNTVIQNNVYNENQGIIGRSK